MPRIAEITLSVEPDLIRPSELDIKHSALPGIRERRSSGLTGKILDPNNQGRRLIKIAIHEGEKTRISIPSLHAVATFINTESGVEVVMEDKMADKSHFPEHSGWKLEGGEKGKMSTARRMVQDASEMTIFTDSLVQISLTVADQV